MQCVFNARDIKQIIMPRNIATTSNNNLATLFSGSFLYSFTCFHVFMYFKVRVRTFSSTLKNSFTVFPGTKKPRSIGSEAVVIKH